MKPTSRPTMALVLAASLATGCSFVMNRGVDNWRPSKGRPTCSDSRAAPVADLVIGGILLSVLATAYVATRTCDGELCGLHLLYGLPAGALSVPYFIAAPVGFHNRKNCKQALREHQRWQRTQPPKQYEDRDIRPECRRFIEQWRRESNLSTKTKLYDRMPEDCRESITRRRAPTGAR